MTQVDAASINFGSVRYTQDVLYPYFSNGKMSIFETYLALANGFLDPTSLGSIPVFEVDGDLYCINTRRLTIIKELQKNNKHDTVKQFIIQYIRKDNQQFREQCWNLVNERIPAIRRQGLHGSTIQPVYQFNNMCCYNQATIFPDDLDKHIAETHFKMDLDEFNNLNIYKCNECGKQANIIAKKHKTNSYYSFHKRCMCPDSETSILHRMNQPWTEVTFSEFCKQFIALKTNLESSKVAENNAKESGVFKRQPFLDSSYTKSSSNVNNNRTTAVEKNVIIKPFYLFMLFVLSILVILWLSLPNFK